MSDSQDSELSDVPSEGFFFDSWIPKRAPKKNVLSDSTERQVKDGLSKSTQQEAPQRVLPINITGSDQKESSQENARVDVSETRVALGDDLEVHIEEKASPKSSLATASREGPTASREEGGVLTETNLKEDAVPSDGSLKQEGKDEHNDTSDLTQTPKRSSRKRNGTTKLEQGRDDDDDDEHTPKKARAKKTLTVSERLPAAWQPDKLLENPKSKLAGTRLHVSTPIILYYQLVDFFSAY